MKSSYFLYSLLLLILLTNCTKQKMDVYNSGYYVQFTAPEEDTVNLSFFFYPGKAEINYAMPVKLVGLMTGANLTYEIKVDDKASTALPKNYNVPASFQFLKGQGNDSARIKFINSPELASKPYLLALEIVSGNEVSAGQQTHIRKIIRISDIVSKPEWWDEKMDRFGLGEYSERKIRKFIEVTGVGDLDKYDLYGQREFILQFRNYLVTMKAAGTPVLEEDGTDMLSTITMR